MRHNKSEASWRGWGIKDAIQKLPPRVDSAGFYFETANPSSSRRLNDTLRAAYRTGYQCGKQATYMDVNVDGTVAAVYLIPQDDGVVRVIDAATLSYFYGAGWYKDWDEDTAPYYKAFRPGNQTALPGQCAELDDLAWVLVSAHLAAKREREESSRRVREQWLLDSIHVRPDKDNRYQGCVNLWAEGAMLRDILQDALKGYPPTETSRTQIEAILERLNKYGKLTSPGG